MLEICGKELIAFFFPSHRMSVAVAPLALILLVACATTCPLRNPWVQYLRILSMS